MEKAQEKASILIEALPYIKKFRGKEILVKYGGAAMEDPSIRTSILSDLVFMSLVGIRPILVHGGGPAITAAMKKEGIEAKFVNGHRVTDKKTIEVVTRTLANINKQLVKEINELGARAIGLSGCHNHILDVVKHPDLGDVGYVGQVTSVDIMPIKELTEFNIIPVIYPLGIGENDEVYNVNGDEATAKIAIAMQIQKLMMLTSVPGIMRDLKSPDTLISSIKVEDVGLLKEQNVVSGGMIPKVDCCVEVLRNGINKAHIVDARIKHSLLLEIFTEEGIGTEIVKEDSK